MAIPNVAKYSETLRPHKAAIGIANHTPTHTLQLRSPFNMRLERSLPNTLAGPSYWAMIVANPKTPKDATISSYIL